MIPLTICDVFYSKVDRWRCFDFIEQTEERPSGDFYFFSICLILFVMRMIEINVAFALKSVKMQTGNGETQNGLT